MNHPRGTVSAIFFIAVILFACPVSADQDLAKQSQNPIGNMISLPMQNNTYFNVGPSDEWANSFQLQPVLPINFGPVNLINRMIIPFNHLEDQEVTVPVREHLGTQHVTFEADGTTGLGDITYQGFISPAKPGKLIWGVGPVLQIPTNTDDRLGTDKWSAGPGFVALAMPGKWVLGCLGYNIWSFAGPSDEDDVNSLIFQYFINYNITNGWYLTSAPIMTANWKEDSDGPCPSVGESDDWSNSASNRLISGSSPSGMRKSQRTARIGHCSSKSNCYFQNKSLGADVNLEVFQPDSFQIFPCIDFIQMGCYRESNSLSLTILSCPYCCIGGQAPEMEVEP